MNREQVFTRIFNILEEIDGINYDNKYPKSLIIESLSQINIPPWKYLKFNRSDGFSNLLSKIIKVELLRPNGRHWDYHLLYLIGYKYCKQCNTVHKHSKFGTDSRRKDNLGSKCKECDNTRAKKYRKDKPEIAKEYSKNRKINNPEYIKNYYIKHKEEYLARCNKRRAVKLNATPRWYEKELIEKFYKNRPKGYHVDHIIPLQNDKVCGLHVISNLQYLTSTDNLSKGNKYEV